MKGRGGRTVTVICRNINPKLRYVLSLFLIEVTPLVYTGRLNSKVCDELWEQLNVYDSKYEITMLINSNTEDGFTIRQNFKATETNTGKIEGLTLSKRRVKAKEPWEKILGKTIPFEYPLVLHLIDSMAVGDALWDNYLSSNQKNFLAERLGITLSETKSLVLYTIGMHDIGKANPYWLSHTLKLNSNHSLFQDFPWKECSDQSDNWRHDLAGGVYFANHSQIAYPSYLGSLLIRTTSGHHGHFQDDKVLGMKEDFSTGKLWVEAQQNIEALILQLSGMQPNMSVQKPSDSVTLLITGLVVLADWLASNSKYIYAVHQNYPTYQNHYVESVKHATNVLKREGLQKPVWKENLSWGNIFPLIPNPNPLQETFITHKSIFEQPGILLISAPMGMGKTESSLYAAAQFGKNLKLNGTWVALPTKATTNAMFERMVGVSDKWFNQSLNTVALMHSSSLIAEAIANTPTSERISSNQILGDKTATQIYDTESVQDFISSFLQEKRQGGLSNLVTSTVDQMINVSIPLKHNMLRWVGLTNKTLILDEVHDFDVYTFGLIKKLVEWCATFQVPVIAMSATLSKKSQQDLFNAYVMNLNPRPPENKKENFVPAEGINSPGWLYGTVSENKIITTSEAIPEEKNPVMYQTYLTKTKDFTETVTTICLEENKHNPTILVVCNTVNQATGIYRNLSTNSDIKIPIMLLHSRMTETQKTHIIKSMMEKVGKKASHRSPHILVATQIVQQSMDIDYDMLITPLAPLPDLLQRVGRVHRHPTPKRSHKYVNNPLAHIIVPIEHFQSPSDKSKTTRPYYMIDLIVTLKTLENEGLSFNYPVLWDAKNNLTSLFNKADTIFGEQSENSLTKPFLVTKENKEFVQETKKNEVTVLSPHQITPTTNLSSRKLTAPYTSKSKDAASTRLINPQETINFTHINPTTKELEIVGFLPNDQTGVVETQYFALNPGNMLETLKLLSKHAFTVPEYVYKKFESMLVTDTLLENYSTYTKFIDYSRYLSAINNNENLIHNQGFVDAFIDPESAWI